jgi:predicted RNase H-like HicB family nuclease
MSPRSQGGSSATLRPMRLQASITQEGSGFVAQCLEVDVASQGNSAEEALRNLQEALELFFEGEPPQRQPIRPALIRTVELPAR